MLILGPFFRRCFSNCWLLVPEHRNQNTVTGALLSLSSSKNYFHFDKFRNSPPEMFLRKGVLKICSKFTGEQPCWIAISIKLQSNFIEIELWHGCSLINLLYIFRAPFPRNTSGRLLLRVLLFVFARCVRDLEI